MCGVGRKWGCFSIVADLGEAMEAVMKTIELAGPLEEEVGALTVQVGLLVPPVSCWGHGAAW